VRHALEGVHPRFEGARQAFAPGKQFFFLVRVQGRDARGAGERMPGVGVAVEELHARRLAAGEGLVDRVLDDHAAQRHRARGHALGVGDEVGLDTKMLCGERRAEPAPAGDHFVEHQEDAVARADLAQALEIAFRRHQHAARSGHRVDDDSGDVRSVVQRDQALELVGQVRAAVGRLAFGEQVSRHAVRMPQMVDPRQQRATVGLAVRRHAAERDAAEVHAVIGALAADEAGARALAAQAVVADGDLHRGVDRLGARVGEEHVAHALGRKRGDALREAEGERVAEREGGGEVELARLLADRLDDARSRMARVHAPQGRQAIEHLTPVGSSEVHVLCGHHQLRSCLEAAVVGERHPVMLEVHAVF
jgi:hypothetical protein